VSSSVKSPAFKRDGDGKSVNIRGFKEFVAKNFDEKTPLYKVLLSEKDEVSREDLAAKFDVWLRLVALSL
jgi:hypothetical protein